ncbi:mannosylglycerate hydrolase [Streptococcus uberis]|uniref:glycoside hydrolase family 38 N-terminal domain-containing protein n=1 Tax=Streptococcus uberis TaxID=1349 RepID=UPI0012B523C1|nr:glycoside hydrolase family 38 C-terminal domain-containing protein [Streptococcus uberis]MCK1220659.1 hypothetical protein [Streptococcus uberis]MCR4257747.1 hypothetical protein [Streptococcus uberis]MCZ8466565.1 hypothetical protein [Streptococcus uberis]MTB69083.1 alpha-mannosidase [Streptococcus uberis]MTC88873.1 alpha-mannosidase [Streptococcus uberis]
MKFSIVAHTHWDREWHKTFEEYRVRLVTFFDDLIETLEQNSDFSFFVMDGQMAVFEDYLAIKPEKKDSLKTLIENKRLIIGPWYTQPDELIPNGESLIRNLLIGKEMANTFSDEMEIGYLPDSFGQSANIPQLLKGFHYNRAIFWRGMTGEETTSENFIWESSEGSQVETTVLSQGYGNARDLSLDLDKNIAIIEDNIDKLADRSPNGHILLMCGFDQRKVKKELPEIISQLNTHYKGEHEFTLSNFTMYQDDVFESDANKEIVSGEFRKGKHMRVHVGIGMTRSDIKRQNYDVETELYKVSEPLSSIRFLESGTYPKSLHDQASKYMLQNQAHDSICNVCTDDTHREMSIRYRKSLQLSSELKKMAYEDIFNTNGEQIFDLNKIALFHLNSHQTIMEKTITFYSRFEKFNLVYSGTNENLPFTLLEQEKINLNDTTIEIGVKNEDIYLYKNVVFISSEVSGFGIYYFNIIEEITSQDKIGIALYHDGIIENDKFTLILEDDGTFTYQNKKSKEKFYHLNRIVENGNAGDEYDYSPPVNDILNVAKMVESEIVINTDKLLILDVYYTLTASIDSNVLTRSSETKQISLKTRLTIGRASEKIDFKTSLVNTVKNHRISVVFENNQKTRNHFSEQQFGLIWRDNTVNITEEEFENWQEKYYPVFPQQRFTGFRSKQSNMIILNKGLVNYELTNQSDVDDITIPLLTSTDYMGKQDLLYRPGRRSGLHVATPDSEMRGEYHFEYSFYEGKLEKIGEVSDNYQTEPQMTQDFMNDEEDKIYFTNHTSEMSLQTVKKSLHSNAIIVRFVNVGDKELDSMQIRFDENKFSDSYLVSFADKKIGNQARLIIENNTIKVMRIKKNEVISIALERK